MKIIFKALAIVHFLKTTWENQEKNTIQQEIEKYIMHEN